MAALSAQVFQHRTSAVAQPQKPNLTSCISRGQVTRPFGPIRVRRTGRASVTRAASTQGEADSIVAKITEKYENAQNKPAVIAYTGGSVTLLIFAEWLINKPGLNILLGFPVQLIGLLFLPGLVNKYLVEKKSAGDDAKSALNNLIKKLPGLENESW